MFVIQKCESLRDYDLFLEQMPQMEKGLYPKYQDERIISINQVPKSILDLVEWQAGYVIKSAFVHCKYDLNDKREIVGEFIYRFETEDHQWIQIVGEYEDWKEYCKLILGVSV